MTAPSPPPVGFLDFFILEASDYIEQLDAQLKASGDSGPATDDWQRPARALRGSATMAKLGPFAEMAAGLERVGRSLRDGSLSWNAALHGVLVAAVDDCKLLLRNARAWTPTDDARARARIDELTRYAPLRAPTPLATPTTAGHDSYLATEAANIGAGLELLATRPGDRDAAGNVLRRVRALRGIASVKDHPSLAEVLEAAEIAAHPLELGEPALSPERIALLNAAACLLRTVAGSIRNGSPSDPAGPEATRFAAALDAMHRGEAGAERVVPVSELFFDDGGATIVDAAPNPPTSPAERFRLEVVSQGEHLQRLVSDARQLRDEPARDRIRRALRAALRSLRQSAESFGERDVAEFVSSQNDSVARLDSRALDSLAQMAALLAQPGGTASSLADRLRGLRDGRAAVTPPLPSPTPVSYTPSAMMTPIAGAPIIAPAPSGAADRDRPAAAALAAAVSAAPAGGTGTSPLSDLLDRGIRTLGTLPSTPLSTPATLPEQPPVPIDVLLYRGRAALERARDIRDESRRASVPLEPERLAELFDLLDLALTN